MIIETKIERPAAGGEFIARHEGRIVFVKGGISGENVRVEVKDPEQRFWRGEVVEILEKSPHRTAQSCPAARRGAGCCDWSHIAFGAAAEFKGQIVVDCLSRLAGFRDEDLPRLRITTLPPTTGWRNRVRLGIDNEGRAGLRAARSNLIIFGTDCSQNIPGLMDGVDQIGYVAQEKPQASQRRRVRQKNPGELHVVVDTGGNRHVVHVQGGGKNRRERVLEGSATYIETVEQVEFRVPVTGFWQAHSHAVNYYIDAIRTLLPDAPGAVAWDLYGGVGVFSLGLAPLVGEHGKVLSVEAYSKAAASGRQALANYPVEFRAGDVRRVVREVTAEKSDLSAPHIVVLDPPRAGAGADVVAEIVKAGPDFVVHIGCDPATFSRDAKAWKEAGYRMESLEVVDAFPGTHHCETIALFRPTAPAGTRIEGSPET